MITVKGKHLDSLKIYADALRFDDPATHLPDFGPFDAVRRLIVGAHQAFMDDDTAYRLALSVYFKFALKLNPEMSCPVTTEKMLRGQTDALVQAFKTEIESLPRSYQLRFELPMVQTLGSYRIELSETVALVGGTQHGFDSIPVGFDDVREAQWRGLAAASAAGKIPAVSTYIEVSAIGYTDASTGSALAAKAISAAKQAVFLLRGEGLFMRSGTKLKARLTMYDASRGVSRTVPAPSGFDGIFGKVGLQRHDLRMQQAPAAGLFGESEARLATTDAEVVKTLKFRTDSVRRFFSLADTEEAQSIGAAIEWYLDAETGENETLAYLSCCIGLEAILGDHSVGKDRDLVSTSRLIDRYAFLLGKNHEARRRLRKEYDDILTARGDLVHGRAFRLPAEHRLKLHTVRGMLWRVIWHEYQSLLVASPPGARD